MTRHLPFLITALVACACCSAKAGQAGKPYTRNVAIVVYDGVEVLDFSGPSEVFADAAYHGARADEPAFKLFTLAPSAAPVTSQGFLKVVPDYTFDNAPRVDILVIPGGNSGALAHDEHIVSRVKDLAQRSELTLTVCSGAFVLARTGLLDGLDATTFYAAVEPLQASAPKVRVHPGRRFIDSGHFVTTAGVSAGIDGSLHVVARLLGQRVADQTARNMEYRWTPEPYLTAGYQSLNPSLDERGRLLQQADIATEERRWQEAERVYRQAVQQDPQRPDAWLGLGGMYMARKDYGQAADAYRRAVAAGHKSGAALYNLACAYARSSDRKRALDTLAEAVSAGMKDRGHMAHDPDLESLHGDPRFQQIISAR